MSQVTIFAITLSFLNMSPCPMAIFKKNLMFSSRVDRHLYVAYISILRNSNVTFKGQEPPEHQGKSLHLEHPLVKLFLVTMVKFQLSQRKALLFTIVQRTGKAEVSST